MKPKNDNYIFQKVTLMMPLSDLPPEVVSLLPEVENRPYQMPNPISIRTAHKQNVRCDKNGGHYFVGGLPALMQAVRQLQSDQRTSVTYVNDGAVQKSAQSAHQGHVHPTEWTTPELGCWELSKIMLRGLGLLRAVAPDDVERYSYIHFPPSEMKVGLLMRNMAFKIIHKLLSKQGVSEDDRWQCQAVRASLAFHKELSDEIHKSGHEPTFASSWRLIWSANKKAIEKKRALWNALGIATEYVSPCELRTQTLLRDDIPLYGVKVLEDGKFFPQMDQKIAAHLSRKYPQTFHMRQAVVSEVYVDPVTRQPFAVREVLPDKSQSLIAVESFYGSLGHNQVFTDNSKKPLWDEVAVSGVSTLWVCTVEKESLLHRLGTRDMTDDALIQCIKEFVGAANLTNLHTTVWDACVESDQVHIVIRATEGANFNSEFAHPDDLHNMIANIQRFFIGSWKLVTAGSCTRKTTTSNVPEYTDHFIHGLSGIGVSFSGAPKEMLFRKGLSPSSLF